MTDQPTAQDYDQDTPARFTQAESPGEMLLSSRRGDGWTADRQRTFLATLAEGNSVKASCWMVGLTTSSAYAFRNSRAGVGFRAGWQGALLVQRAALADKLTERAFEGQTVTTTHADGRVTVRRSFDNRLGLALLNRLDCLADASERCLTGEGRAARRIAEDWSGYLEAIGGDDAARTRAYLEAPQPVDTPVSSQECQHSRAASGQGTPSARPAAPSGNGETGEETNVHALPQREESAPPPLHLNRAARRRAAAGRA